MLGRAGEADQAAYERVVAAVGATFETSEYLVQAIRGLIAVCGDRHLEPQCA
jgi:hypothetical protein